MNLVWTLMGTDHLKKDIWDNWRNLTVIGFQMMLRDYCNFVKCDMTLSLCLKGVPII